MNDSPSSVIWVILLVEDDPQIRRFLRASRTAEQYKISEALTASEGIAQAAARQPDLILLDLGLPDKDGLEVILEVRKWSTVPIIVLSARGQDQDKITALDLGADDYVAKPFNSGELLARMRVALRRMAKLSSASVVTEYMFGDVVVDFEKRLVRKAGEVVHLTPHEFKLVSLLARNAGKVLTQRELLH